MEPPDRRPGLIIGIRYDPPAAYHNAVELSHQMPGSRLLTLDGWGHPTILNSPCVDEATDRYLIDGALPPPGSVCPSDLRPFGPPPSPRLETLTGPRYGCSSGC